MRITAVSARDIRFPASCDLSSSDAMHEAPDCSAAHVVFRTDAGRASSKATACPLPADFAGILRSRLSRSPASVPR